MNVHVPPREARRSAEWFDGLPDALEDAFDRLDQEATEAYAQLQELATAVRIEGHSIDAESSVIERGKWTAPGTIYVTLIYEPNSDEPVEFADSYPITLSFTVNDGLVEIDNISADTSSFYE